ncbi:MAG: SDR family NAD(P)-dependent oxidoreductase [Sphingomonadales bacterium]|nr:SDR family NAD(P)-dependent oxidoreductase [Sphingomonadales bacterium]
MTKHLEGKLALVTGASRGIGRSVALQLAKAGAKVICVARTQGGLEELDDDIQALGLEPAVLVPLDLKDGDAIDRLGGVVAKKWGKLDILVANAGVLGPITPVSHIQPRNWDEVIAVNLTAQWRLIRSFDVLLRASDNGRAIFVSSGAVNKANPYWGAYSASKAASDHLVKIYAAENESTPLRVNLINPGATRTVMRAAAYPGEDPETLPHPDDVARLFIQLCGDDVTETGQVFTYPDDLKS